MEAGISSAPEANRLVFILEIIFDVTHLVMNGEQLLHSHGGALFDSVNNKHIFSSSTVYTQYTVPQYANMITPEVLAVVEVPGRCMTDHLSPIIRFLQHGLVPELRRHGNQSQRCEELLGHPEHVSGIIALWTKSTFLLDGVFGKDVLEIQSCLFT